MSVSFHSQTLLSYVASAASSAPLYTLEGLRSADPVLGLALLMIVALVAGELVHRLTRLPRAVGQMLVGALASPLALRLLDRTDLDPWKPLIDLAVGMLVFELGSRIRPRWLIDNPWLTLSCICEAVFAGLAVTWALMLLGAPAYSAVLAGAVAMSTSPVITMTVIHEAQPRGQVTERVLMMAALNSVLAVLALKAWRVVVSADAAAPGVDWQPALVNAVYVLAGSFLLGAAAGIALTYLARWVPRSTTSLAVLQIALVVLAAMLAAQWMLSPLLALLLAGVVARARMSHHLTVEPQLGSAGAALTVLLFLSIGVLSTLDDLVRLWPWVLAILLARLLGKAAAVFALARPSGLGWHQAAALTLALQPMTNVAVLLAATTFGWPGETPAPDAAMLQSLLIATTLMQLSGPWWTQLGLSTIARETKG
jgi:Kef-type K+ transport system membrane component KefB